MLLFIKGFIIGIGKIIPGVSGAMLAINFNVYERAIDSVLNFFNDWKNNLKFLVLFGSGIILSIIICSNLMIYLLNNYFFVTMMLFLGLILGGTISFSKNIKFNFLKIGIIILISLIFTLISVSNINTLYVFKNNFFDNLMFFFGGFIEIMTSIVPGISGTAIEMMIGIYDNILLLISNIFNVSYVFDNFNLYISFGIGMGISFIICSYLINYFLKRYREYSYVIILGLSISSIIFLVVKTFSVKFIFFEFVVGVMFFMFGLLSSMIMGK